MDQNNVRLERDEPLQAGQNRGLPRCTTRDRAAVPQARRGLPEQVGIVGMDDRLHRTDTRVLGEPGNAHTDHRNS